MYQNIVHRRKSQPIRLAAHLDRDREAKMVDLMINALFQKSNNQMKVLLLVIILIKSKKRVWKNPTAQKEILAGLARINEGELLPRHQKNFKGFKTLK